MLLSKSVMVPQKIKNRNTIQFSNSTTEYLPKEYENSNLKRYMHPMFIAAVFTITNIEQQLCIHRQINV